jgi:hypothetical protein
LVFPNPTVSELSIVSQEENVLMKITDFNGQLIDEINLIERKSKVDLRNYQNGIYFYSISNKEKTRLFKSKFVLSK